jgi:hypothetical protein
MRSDKYLDESAVLAKIFLDGNSSIDDVMRNDKNGVKKFHEIVP